MKQTVLEMFIKMRDTNLQFQKSVKNSWSIAGGMNFELLFFLHALHVQ